MNSLIARPFVLLLLAVFVLCNSAPAADCWQRRSLAPLAARAEHTSVWTGTEMIIWGGVGVGGVYFNDGARYNPTTDTWMPVADTGAPSARYRHSAVWTGTEMITWGGGQGSGSYRLNTGARYNPATNSWTPVTTAGAPDARFYHAGVWTGSEMIVWGGYNGTTTSTGGRYNPATNTWTATSSDAPAGRYHFTAVWTGSEMIVWGGRNLDATRFNGGGRYNPAGDSWTILSTAGAPAAREYQTATWTGSEMIIWGGLGSTNSALNTGGRYNPAADSWTAVTTSGAPPASAGLPAVWTGSEMIVWGGSTGGSNVVNTGGRYSPEANSWSAVTTDDAPAKRSFPTSVWTGNEMLLWGGFSGSSYFNDTFSYTPDCDVFRITTVVLDSGNLLLGFPTLTGRSYTLWQSDTLEDGTWTDTGLSSIAGDGSSKVFSVGAPAAGIPKRFYRVQALP